MFMRRVIWTGTHQGSARKVRVVDQGPGAGLVAEQLCGGDAMGVERWEYIDSESVRAEVLATGVYRAISDPSAVEIKVAG